MSRRPALPVVLVVLAALLLGVDTLAWLGMQRLLDRRVSHLLRDARPAGWQLAIASEQRGGWPFAATLTLSAPRLHGADGLVPGGITWSAERITAVFSPAHPRRITFLAGGTEMISAAALTGSAPNLAQSLRFWGAETALHLPVGSHGRPAVSFDAGALHVAFPGAGPDDVLTVAGLEGTLRWNSDAQGNTAARALRIGLHGVRLPISGGRGVGGAGREAAGSPNAIGSATAELSLIGRLAPGGGDFASRVRSWRDGGGRVLLREAALDWGGAAIRATGAARLDGNFQPDGAFSVRISGAGALLDSMVRSGRMTESAAGAVRAVLGLIGAARIAESAAPGGTGEPGALELPLTLRSGTLLLGQIPLLRIPFPAIGQGAPGTGVQPMAAQP